MWKPLPSEVTIKSSSIEGLGLFATKDIEKGHEFGITHIEDERFPYNYIRTSLGGFINHSKESNCIIYKEEDLYKLKSSKLIKEGEEITLTYSLMGYNIEGDKKSETEISY